MAEETATGYLDSRIEALREHVASLVAALPTLPQQFEQVREQVAQEMAARGHGVLLALIVLFLGLGFAVEGAYRYATPDRSQDPHRLKAIGLRFARDAGAVATFALGSIVVFLVFHWPAHTRNAIIAFFVALIALRAGELEPM